jgi:Bacterial PH domain
VFRLGTQFIIWWAWVAFAIFNVFELVLRDRDYFSIEVVAALLAITGLAYACALRPRVLADDEGVLVQNPFQDHWLPWGAVNGVYLGDSVEFSCARAGPKKEKTVYCWALYSGRRKRMRAQMQRSFFSFNRTPSRAPAEVREMSRLATVQLMAAELGRRATRAKADGAPGGVLQSRWHWPALIALLAPAAALLALILAK